MTGAVFVPVTCHCIGNPDAGYEFVYRIRRDHQASTLTGAARSFMREEGHDDFLVAEATEDGLTLLDVTAPDGEPLASWGQESYRSLAEGVGARWSPKPGTVAADAPEEDQERAQ